MLWFENDYSAGAHPFILKRLTETNLENLAGYGEDTYCQGAREKIRSVCNCPNAEIEFLVAVTQTNAVVISTMLNDYEGVIAAKTGHISLHEAGAIEFTGHKVLEIPHKEGKIEPNTLKEYMEDFYGDSHYAHMVFPGMVYISHPTEYGTLYTKRELQEIASICNAYRIPLFLDGARLGYALVSAQSDLNIADIAQLCDVFYIGGTKVGALCGEAVIFTKQNKPSHFMTSVKKRGALLAKGRLLGIQFDALFTDNLYFEISKHVIQMAEKLKMIFQEKDMNFYLESPTNQQFIIMDNNRMKELEKEVRFSFWEKYEEDSSIIRFVTSWSTSEEDLDALKEIIKI